MHTDSGAASAVAVRTVVVRWQAGLGSAENLLPYLDPDLKLPVQDLPAITALYDGEIAYTDHQLERVFAWLREKDRSDDTIVVVVSDHREQLGEHGRFGHEGGLHAEVTRIALIMRVPQQPKLAGRRQDLVSLLDLPLMLISRTGHPDLHPHSFANGQLIRTLQMAPSQAGPARLF